MHMTMKGIWAGRRSPIVMGLSSHQLLALRSLCRPPLLWRGVGRRLRCWGIDPDSVPLRALTDKGLALVVAHGPAVRTSYLGDGEEMEGGLRDAVTLMALAHVRASRLPVRYVPISAVRDYYRARRAGEVPGEAPAESSGAEWVVIDFGHGLFDPAPLDDEARPVMRGDGAARACVVGVGRD